MSKILYIAEGEIEERFIRFLAQNDFIQAGRFRKFNLMQNRLKMTNAILSTKFDRIYCIIDTDVLTSGNISNLIFNLKQLKSICPREIFLLIQCENFEEELKFLFNCTDLGKFFNLKYQSVKDLKIYLTQKIDYKNHITKSNLIRYCTRPEKFVEALSKFNRDKLKLQIVSVEKCIV